MVAWIAAADALYACDVVRSIATGGTPGANAPGGIVADNVYVPAVAAFGTTTFQIVFCGAGSKWPICTLPTWAPRLSGPPIPVTVPFDAANFRTPSVSATETVG